MDGEKGGGVRHFMTLPLKRYADFDGRSQRAEYWWYTLAWWLVVIGLYILFGAATFTALPEPDAPGGGEGSSAVFWIALIAIIAFFLLTLIPNIAVTVRRFHDQDKSGWLYLLNFVPYIGALVIIVFMCLEGTRGPNGYGDDPKAENTASVFE